jgi:L,D-transpeptidase ErfK/SrfK
VRIFLFTFIISLFIISHTYASSAFPIDNPANIIIGTQKIYSIYEEETLIELARKYDVGYNEIIAANSDIDSWVPEKGTKIIIPTTWLLPEVLDDGIIINLAEMRLYYFFAVENTRYVRTFPVGIGRQGVNTPTGTFKITAKLKDPVWRVPETIRKEDPELPPFVLPGPYNPLGGYWLQLSVNGYGIHGTNRPYGIGREVSHGCIRLYQEDIKILFNLVKPGTKVIIINEPVKVGLFNKHVYAEIHNSEKDDTELISLTTKKLSMKNMLKDIDTLLLINTIKRSTGLPTIISKFNGKQIHTVNHDSSHQIISNTNLLIYTIQIGSFIKIKRAQKLFKSIIKGLKGKELDYLRIEKIGEFYSVRLRKFENYTTAKNFLKLNKTQLSAAIILKAYIKYDRVVKLYE